MNNKPQVKYGIQVTLESTKSDGKAFRILGGRPRILVDFAMVLRMRDVYNWGWSRMAKEYIKDKGQYVSPDTLKRRYHEAKDLEKNQDSQADGWK